MDEDDQKEGLFKRLKNIENPQKNLINRDDNESIYYTPRSQFDSEHDKDGDEKKTQQNNNIDTKPLKVFYYLKGLSQEPKDLMHEIKDAGNDIDIYKLDFIGSNWEKFNFNTFRMPLEFLSDIYNAQIILKEIEFFETYLRKHKGAKI